MDSLVHLFYWLMFLPIITYIVVGLAAIIIAAVLMSNDKSNIR